MASLSHLISQLSLFGLSDSPLLTQMLTAYVVTPDKGRIELGEYLLVNLCIDHAQIMSSCGYVPGKQCSLKGVVHGTTKLLPIRVDEVNPTAISLELNGKYLGYVREDGVFIYATTDRAYEFIRWIQATDLGHLDKEDPTPSTRTHLDLTLQVSSQELAVVAHGGWLERKLCAQQATSTDDAKRSTLTLVQQENHAS